MRLLMAPASPFSRKVRAVIRETGLDATVEEVETTANALDPNPTITAANPLGKIPTLLRDDGPALYDSRVICRFLDSAAGGKLYPAPPRLWDTLTLEATADAIMEAGVLIVYEARYRPESLRSGDWVETQWQKAARAVAAIDSRWMSHLAGPLDIGQIAVACALGYLDFRMPERDWRRGHDALAAWYEGFAERPSMASTRPA